MKKKLFSFVFVTIFYSLSFAWANSIFAADPPLYKIVLNTTNLYSDINFSAYWGTAANFNNGPAMPMGMISDGGAGYNVYFYGNELQQVEFYVLIYKKNSSNDYDLLPLNSDEYTNLQEQYAQAFKLTDKNGKSLTLSSDTSTGLELVPSSIDGVNKDNNYMRDVCKYFNGDIVSNDSDHKKATGSWTVAYTYCHSTSPSSSLTNNYGSQGIDNPYDSIFSGQSAAPINKYYFSGCFNNGAKCINDTIAGFDSFYKFNGSINDQNNKYSIQVSLNLGGANYSSNAINLAPIAPPTGTEVSGQYHKFITNDLALSGSIYGSGAPIDNDKLAPNISDVDYAQHVGILDVYPPIKTAKFQIDSISNKEAVVIYNASSPNSGIAMYGVSAYCVHAAEDLVDDGTGHKVAPNTFIQTGDCFGYNITSGNHGILFDNNYGTDVFGNKLEIVNTPTFRNILTNLDISGQSPSNF